MLANLLISAWPPATWRDRRILVAASGGADSTALLLLLHDLADPGQLVVAHFNHGWRGAESDADEAFVSALCRRLDRPCLVGHNQAPGRLAGRQTDIDLCREVAMLAKEDARALKAQSSFASESRSEASARAARYDFLAAAAYQAGASYVVAGHTADDRVETLLHNLLRGSGLAGATSLTQFRSLDSDLVLVRPLLQARRSQILEELARRGQPFRTDSSNEQRRYRRNFIRLQLLPEIVDLYPHAPENLLHFSALAEQTQSDIETLARRWRHSAERLVDQARTHPTTADLLRHWPTDKFYVIALSLCADATWTVLRQALRSVWLERDWPQADMTLAHWQQLREALMGSQPGVYPPAAVAAIGTRYAGGRFQLPGNLQVAQAGGFLSIGSCSKQAS